MRSASGFTARAIVFNKNSAQPTELLIHLLKGAPMGSDLDTLIIRSDPLWGHEPPDVGSIAGRQLYEQLLTDNSRKRGELKSRGLPLAIGSAAVAAILAVVLVVVSQTAPSVSAAAALTRIAHIVGTQESPTLRPGQTFYSVRTATIELTFSNVNGVAVPPVQADFPVSIQIWADNEGDVSYGERFGTAQFTSPAAQTAWLAAGLPVQLSAAEQYFTGGGSNGLDVARLPDHATALRALIAKGNTGIPEVDRVPSGPSATGQRVTLLLLGPDIGATPRFYSALYQVLSTVPGVRKLGTVTTHSGKTGEGFALGSSGPADQQERIIVDPRTGKLLEAQNVIFGEGLEGQSTSVYAVAPTSQILNRMAEPRTLGSDTPALGLFISATSTDRIVSDKSLPNSISGTYGTPTG
jgi:hypothetical protein